MGSGSSATRAVAQLVLLDSTFDPLPAVVGEGRRVLGNIERTSNLYVTKTVYAMLIALGVGVSVPVPFLPRQLTLIGALIRIPSFFLALAPNDGACGQVPRGFSVHDRRCRRDRHLPGLRAREAGRASRSPRPGQPRWCCSTSGSSC
jgi:magnesium-transporting ATPase (P-type)